MSHADPDKRQQFGGPGRCPSAPDDNLIIGPGRNAFVRPYYPVNFHQATMLAVAHGNSSLEMILANTLVMEAGTPEDRLSFRVTLVQ